MNKRLRNKKINEIDYWNSREIPDYVFGSFESCTSTFIFFYFYGPISYFYLILKGVGRERGLLFSTQ